MATYSQESGHLGPLVSLGGTIGVKDRGRQIYVNGMSASTIGQQALPNNPQRISAIIQNLDAAIPILVDLGQTGEPSISIFPKGSLQIDINFPYTGSVWVYTAAGTASMYVTEISVP